MQLDSKKILTEIEELKRELEEHIKRKGDFENLHERALRLSKIIFSVRKDYKEIDRDYPSPVVIKFDKAFSGSDEELQIPSEDQILEGKINFGKAILAVLDNAHKIHSLKLKLQKDK